MKQGKVPGGMQRGGDRLRPKRGGFTAESKTLLTLSSMVAVVSGWVALSLGEHASLESESAVALGATVSSESVTIIPREPVEGRSGVLPETGNGGALPYVEIAALPSPPIITVLATPEAMPARSSAAPDVPAPASRPGVAQGVPVAPLPAPAQLRVVTVPRQVPVPAARTRSSR